MEGKIDKKTIAKLLVDTKKVVPLTKSDIGIYVVDIPKAAEKILELIKQKQWQRTQDL